MALSHWSTVREGWERESVSETVAGREPDKPKKERVSLIAMPIPTHFLLLYDSECVMVYVLGLSLNTPTLICQQHYHQDKLSSLFRLHQLRSHHNSVVKHRPPWFTFQNAYVVTISKTDQWIHRTVIICPMTNRILKEMRSSGSSAVMFTIRSASIRP